MYFPAAQAGCIQRFSEHLLSPAGLFAIFVCYALFLLSSLENKALCKYLE